MSPCASLSLSRLTKYGDRYPVDPYDRIWFTFVTWPGWRTVTANGGINRSESDILLVPAEILKTATVAESLAFRFSGGPQEKLYLFLHFAELQQLGPNETREFNVLCNGNLLYGHYRLTYLTVDTLYSARPVPYGLNTTYNFTLEATANSTLPPIINAHEIYRLKLLEESSTDVRDGESTFLLQSSGYVG